MTTLYVSTTGNDATGNGTQGLPFLTIAKAIAAASNGDIIQVAAGTYSQNFDVTKIVTINGPNAGKHGNANDRLAEAILSNTKGNVTAAATINGFKFLHTTVATNDPVISDALIIQAGATIQNCIFERNAAGAGDICRAMSSSSNAQNYNITCNLFTGSTAGWFFSTHQTWNSGIFFTNGGKVGNIENNVFQNCRTAINADDNNSLVTLKDNDFSNCGTYISFGGTTPPTAGPLITNNTFNISNLPSTLINNSNVADSFRLNIVNNKFKFENVSLTSLELSLEQKFIIESKMFHKLRSSRKGIVYYSNNEQCVIANQTTIATAISYAQASGETIYVSAGTYNETLTIDKSVTINGVNKDKTANEVYAATSHSKVVGGFTLNTSGVTINGFEIVSNNSNSYPIIGNTTANNNNNIMIKSNYIHNIKSQQGIYRAVTPNFVSNWLINNNYVSDFMVGTSNTTAIYPNGIDGLTVSNNIINHLTNGGSRRGLNIDGCSNISIINNIIDMNKDTYDDIYAIQLFWSHQKIGNIGPINIQNNNLIGAYYGIVMTSKRSDSSTSTPLQNTIDGITIADNILDTIDWLGIQTGANYYNYNFVMKNVSIHSNIFKNMAFTAISIGPDYYTNYGEYGTFNSSNPPFQNYRIYNNSCINNNNEQVGGLINLYTTPSTTSMPTIVNSNTPATATNLNGIVLDNDFIYLNTGTINGTSGDVGPIPNPIRIITNFETNYVFINYADSFQNVIGFTGISNTSITNLLTNEAGAVVSPTAINSVSDAISNSQSGTTTVYLSPGTYTQTIAILNNEQSLIYLLASPDPVLLLLDPVN